MPTLRPLFFLLLVACSSSDFKEDALFSGQLNAPKESIEGLSLDPPFQNLIVALEATSISDASLIASLNSICQPRINAFTATQKMALEWESNPGLALHACLVSLDYPEMPDSIRVGPENRQRLIKHLGALGSIEKKQQAALPFASRISSEVSLGFQGAIVALDRFQLQVESALNSKGQAQTAQQTKLHNKKIALEKALGFGTEEGYPNEWDPSKELVVTSALLRGVSEELTSINEKRRVFAEAISDFKSAIMEAQAWLSSWPQKSA
ncbi:MAG: hypothetical protein QGH51_02430 [Planctomycetota bacterium]|jgi:hypothetical protein|nr:hypothetical protein [Planctomycetota bacterium]MDP6940860.1 hypothetical protein [Planctomycetota bacterium]